MDETLLSELKAVRSKLARRDGVPAFMIFSEDTLREMCRRLPQSREDFLAIKGVGNRKAARYSKAFLAVLQAYIDRRDAL
jgi:ATP-dependent DNA helicase RecQ